MLALSGEHDLSTAQELRQSFSSAFGAGKSVVTDLSGVEFIDSSIVAVLVECGRPSEGEEPRMAIYLPEQASASVRRVLELTGLGEHITIAESIEGAIEAVQKEG